MFWSFLILNFTSSCFSFASLMTLMSLQILKLKALQGELMLQKVPTPSRNSIPILLYFHPNMGTLLVSLIEISEEVTRFGERTSNDFAGLLSQTSLNAYCALLLFELIWFCLFFSSMWVLVSYPPT